jgi:prophage antirepressor-like protein
MNHVVPFFYDKLKVRTVTGAGGQPWFVAADVCKALGYKNTSKAVDDHLDEDERSSALVPRTSNDSLGVPTNIISESGLYALVLKSQKPEAKRFKRWVTSEVLPSIRKTGAYVPAGLTLETLSPAQASQVGGIIKAVVRKQIEDMLQAELPRLLHGELSRQSVGVRYGRTAGQIMRDHRIPPQKNLANRVSRHLCRQKCQSGTVEVGGKPVKLFDPDAASAQMKLWMYDDCLKYIQEKRGQMQLALVGRVG